MDVILSGAPYRYCQALVDGSGKTFNVESVVYRILDENGAVVTPSTVVVGFTSKAPSVEFDVPLTANALSTGVPRALREVELTCLLSEGSEVILRGAYSLRATDVLVVGVNSFQTLIHARMTALDVPNLTSWDGAGENDVISAMLFAADKLKRLRYQYCEDDNQSRIHAPWGIPGDLTELDPAEFASLPEKFRRALRLAQVAEADWILSNPNEEENQRADGLVMEQIGDVKQQYRAGAVFRAPVCRQAMVYIGRYAQLTPRLTRAG